MQQREIMRARCDEMGLHWAKGVLPQFGGNENAPYIAEWISEREAAIAAALEAKQLALALRNTDAAEVSASAAVDSSKSSAASARAAIFAAVVSFFALVVAVAAYMKQ